VTPIAEIIRDPRYREFAQACSQCGKQVDPDSFPWRCMGMTTPAFLSLGLKYEDGRPMDEAMMATQLAIVRAQERLVEEYWDWWLGWEYLARGKAPAAVSSLPDVHPKGCLCFECNANPFPNRTAAAPPAGPEPGMLF